MRAEGKSEAELKRDNDELEEGKGFVVGAGWNCSGQLGTGHRIDMPMWSTVDSVLHGKIFKKMEGLPVHSVACGHRHMIIVSSEKEVYGAGRNAMGQLGTGTGGELQGSIRPKRLNFFTGRVVHMVACGGSHTLISTSDKFECYAFGNNDMGQLGTGDMKPVYTPKRIGSLCGRLINAMCCGYAHSVVANLGNQVYSMGDNNFGQLGLGDTDNRNTPFVVGNLWGRSIQVMAAGDHHTVVVLSEYEAGMGNDVLCFGANYQGQLGLAMGEDTEKAKERQEIPELCKRLTGKPVLSIACGESHTVVLTGPESAEQPHGWVYTFGANVKGQLGLGHRDDQSEPQRVISLKLHAMEQVGAGRDHTFCRTNRGALYSWGANHFGQLGTEDPFAVDNTLMMEVSKPKVVAKKKPKGAPVVRIRKRSMVSPMKLQQAEAAKRNALINAKADRARAAEEGEGGGGAEVPEEEEEGEEEEEDAEEKAEKKIVRKAVKKLVTAADFDLYPDVTYEKFKSALLHYEETAEDKILAEQLDENEEYVEAAFERIKEAFLGGDDYEDSDTDDDEIIRRRKLLDKVYTLYSYTIHTVLIQYTHCTHTLYTLYSYTIHTVLIH
jgi:alpha-tubulin suppressor-like RCC1 family protein